jgi:hypothetical protein
MFRRLGILLTGALIPGKWNGVSDRGGGGDGPYVKGYFYSIQRFKVLMEELVKVITTARCRSMGFLNFFSILNIRLEES